eukprot:3937559-Rhodomonas_salina.1
MAAVLLRRILKRREEMRAAKEGKDEGGKKGGKRRGRKKRRRKDAETTLKSIVMKRRRGCARISAYAPAMRCPVLGWRMMLRACYAMSGTEIAYSGAVGLRAYCVMSGTDLADGAQEGGWRPQQGGQDLWGAERRFERLVNKPDWFSSSGWCGQI